MQQFVFWSNPGNIFGGKKTFCNITPLPYFQESTMGGCKRATYHQRTISDAVSLKRTSICTFLGFIHHMPLHNYSANGRQTSIELRCPGLPATWYLSSQLLRKCLLQCVWNFSSHVIHEFLNFLWFYFAVRQSSLDSKLFPILSHKQGSLSSNITCIFFSENIREKLRILLKGEGGIEGGSGPEGLW